jgi:hypothetical protein
MHRQEKDMNIPARAERSIMTEDNPHVMTSMQVVAQVRLIQEVMTAVMKEGTHFGTIPGTPKPSLWKPGAEVLCATFRIAPSYQIEDLSTSDSIRYRVRCIGTHQISRVVLGEGFGECSSNEEKSKWRKAANKEFDATPVDRRRVKYARGSNGDYEIKQVRTEPADVANTILKMACKRAQVAMTLNVTAASDIFTQDIEDLPEELRPDEEGNGTASGRQHQGPEPYPDDKMATNMPAYTDLVKSGTKTPADIIKTIKSKYTLTATQEAKINALAKKTGGKQQ